MTLLVTLAAATSVMAAPTWAVESVPPSSPTTSSPTSSSPTSSNTASPSTPEVDPTPPAPTEAQQPAPTDAASTPTVSLTDPGRVEVDDVVTLRGVVQGAGTAVVVVEQLDGSTWREVGRPAVGADGAFGQPVVTPLGETSLRARALVDGREVAATTTTLTGVPARITARLTVPSAAKDYSVMTAAIKVRRVHDGVLLSRRGDVQFRRKGQRTWRTVATWRTSEGFASVRLRPHHDGAYRLSIPSTSRSTSLVTAEQRFTLRPPGAVVTLPKGAPRPTKTLPGQTRPDRPGADVRIEGVGPKTWSSMVGRSWHAGCPVGRSSLRVVRTSYWAYDGYVRRGEIVVHP